MGNGTITTARGLSLNIDEIIQQAQRPIGSVEAASTRESGNYKTPVLNSPKVRGFVPSAGEASLDETMLAEEGVKDEAPKKTTAKKAAPKKKGQTKTLAEMTQVTVKQSEASKKAAAAKKAENDPVIEEEDETLGDIISEMDEK